MDSDRSGLFSLFVDNLPEDVGLIWFRKFFSQYGVVKDAYIPCKRSKVTNRKFGFVRYDCATSAEVAISKANGFWIEDRMLFVKKAPLKLKEKITILIGELSTLPIIYLRNVVCSFILKRRNIKRKGLLMHKSLEG